MKAKFLGALKAAAPFITSLVLIGLNALLGKPVDISAVNAALTGLITSVIVYFTPNLVSVDQPPARDAVSKP